MTKSTKTTTKTTAHSYEVKKAYTELVALLAANPKKTIATMLQSDEFKAIVCPKSAPRAFKTNDAGEVTHVFCYYHKEWEDVSKVAYGTKKSSASGLNSMCKQGTNQWTKQQAVAKAAHAELLTNVAKGIVDHTKLTDLMANIEAERVAIVPLTK